MATRQLPQLAVLDLFSAKEAGQPLMLPLDSIDEDPAQPRREFDEGSLKELAETIAQRGVRQPISVRPHPELPKRWILNTGARRLRAARLAGKTDIPAFVDTTSDSYDQVIENEQRESLKPIELALFVQRRMAAGDSQAEIARRLGKSRQYITYATALIDAPDWLLTAYREGRCKGLTELYELRKLHDEHGEKVEAWAIRSPALTRENIASMRSELNFVGTEAASQSPPSSAMASAVAPVFNIPRAPAGESLVSSAERRTDDVPPAKRRAMRRTRLLAVEFQGRLLELVVDKEPGREGEVFVRALEGGTCMAAPAGDMRLIGFIGG